MGVVVDENGLVWREAVSGAAEVVVVESGRRQFVAAGDLLSERQVVVVSIVDRGLGMTSANAKLTRSEAREVVAAINSAIETLDEAMVVDPDIER